MLESNTGFPQLHQMLEAAGSRDKVAIQIQTSLYQTGTKCPARSVRFFASRFDSWIIICRWFLRQHNGC